MTHEITNFCISQSHLNIHFRSFNIWWYPARAKWSPYCHGFGWAVISHNYNGQLLVLNTITVTSYVGPGFRYTTPFLPQKYLSLENKLYGLSTHKNSVYSGISVCIVLKTYELGEDGEFKEMKSLDLFLHEFSIFNNILPAERVLLFTRYPWWLHRATAMWVCCM